PVSSLLGNVTSCTGFGGYHDDTKLPLADGGLMPIAYAAIPTCVMDANSLTAVISHEWIEAATDPLLSIDGGFSFQGGPNTAFYLPDQDHLVWAIAGGGEAGDLC